MDTPRRRQRKTRIGWFLFCLTVCIAVVSFCVFFDEAVLVRKGTVYRAPNSEKLVALTFDDGPSQEWTPQILDQLEQAGVHATFFMLGEHVEEYPDVARAVAAAGHEIGNHTYDHHVLLRYGPHELETEINRAEEAIRTATGKTTRYFRPPKAWLTGSDKERIKALGYETVLWSLNSKDWVKWDDKYIVAYIEKHVRSGDILLFHDSGGVFKTTGGNRHETVKTIPRLVKKLRARGFTFVTVGELLARSREEGNDVSGGDVVVR